MIVLLSCYFFINSILFSKNGVSNFNSHFIPKWLDSNNQFRQLLSVFLFQLSIFFKTQILLQYNLIHIWFTISKSLICENVHSFFAKYWWSFDINFMILNWATFKVVRRVWLINLWYWSKFLSVWRDISFVPLS